MTGDASDRRRPADVAAAAAGRLARASSTKVTTALGGRERTRVILLLASAPALASADSATVGASAIQLRHDLHINNTDVGLLVTVTSLVAAVASLPFGVLADRVRRTRLLGGAIVLWGAAMIWSATAPTFGQLLLARLFLGGVTAAAGPIVASLVGDLPEPTRGAREPLVSATATPAPAAAGDHGEDQTTDAQRLAGQRGVEPDPQLVLTRDPRRLGLLAAARYVLSIRTNVLLILASAGGYFFLSGVQTFGVEFVTKQYGIAQALSALVLLAVGAAGVIGVLVGGWLGDFLLHRGFLYGRILVSAIAATAAVILFVPAIFIRSPLTALPYISLAAPALSAQNPPIDAARLDIVHPLLWGRAEGIRTALRTLAQATAPLLFGAVSDYVFGGGRSGLQWTFALMLLPLAASAYFLFKALGTYPRDVASASASASRAAGR